MSSMPQNVKTQLQILDKGQHHLVVFKPANMVVVTGRGAPKPTLLDLVQEQFGKNIRPVHRLDRVTTGCCLLAKDLYGQQALSNAFRKRLVNKVYWAIVEGKPDFKKISVDARLKRIDTPKNKKSLAHQIIAEDGDRALTHFKVLQHDSIVIPAKAGIQKMPPDKLDASPRWHDKYTLIEARPITGRMHQIRVHLAHLGHPIVGDKLYGSQTPYHPHAIALHAYSLDFPLPEGGRKQIKASPDAKFDEFMRSNSLK
ncbi:MAG: RNA pseudouridine synthase [Deltaproteobacteria bacterium]|nr:RNA pseudouridine synthase [Deltaproteobacteria bacterium]